MPTPAESGWTSSGLVLPTLTEWLDDTIANVERETDETVVRDPSDPIYQLCAVTAQAYHEQCQLLRGVVSGLDPAQAHGEALDSIARLGRSQRLGAAPSTATLTLTGSEGTVVPAGTRFGDTAETIVLSLDAAATIGSGGTVDADATATENGPRTADTVTQILNPIAGLASVSLKAGTAIAAGRNRETDAELRARIFIARFEAGRGTENAIRAALLRIPSVTTAQVISNRTDAVDAEGRPAHSFEAIVYPDSADADDIAAVILEQEPAGVPSYGLESAVLTDDSDTSRTVQWSYASDVGVDVRITGLVMDADRPDDYETQIETAVRAEINGAEVGEDVRIFRVRGAVASLPWVQTAAVTMRLADTGSFAASDIAMTIRQRALCDGTTSGGQVSFA